MSDDPATEVKALASDPIVTGILDRLRSGLDASLAYHRPAHTEDVVQQALTLATLDALDAHSMLLIAVAAAFHDAGFLVTRSGHESISADMASSAMTGDKRFSQTDIDLVADMIMDTQVYQTGPVHRTNTPLSAWLLDADLANFGRDDFFEQFQLEPCSLYEAEVLISRYCLWDAAAKAPGKGNAGGSRGVSNGNTPSWATPHQQQSPPPEAEHSAVNSKFTFPSLASKQQSSSSMASARLEAGMNFTQFCCFLMDPESNSWFKPKHHTVYQDMHQPQN